jgi:hypothetical protein
MGSNCTKESSNQDLLNSNHVQFKLMQSMHNEPFDGTYDQVDQIGTGSTCQVMKVKLLRWRQRKVPKEDRDSTLIHDCETSRHFAIKEISGVTAEMITEFENEIKLLKAIVSVKDIDVSFFRHCLQLICCCLILRIILELLKYSKLFDFGKIESQQF